MRTLFVLALAGSIFGGALAQTGPPAFPGAEGFGAEAIGGRGGRVIEVTNLNDTGVGSLRAAVEYPGARIVVFRVNGIIDLVNPLVIEHPYITIAGQTAPGDGITLRGLNDPSGVIRIRNTHDVVIRYLRIRQGLTGLPAQGQVNIHIDSGSRDVVIDHCSLSWSQDENLDISRNIPPGADPLTWPEISNVTVQRSLLAEALRPHSTGMRVGGEFDREGWRGIRNLSVHHNAFAHNTSRNPSVAAVGMEIVNNVIYDWGSELGATTSAATVDWVGNLFKPGSLSTKDRPLVHNNFLRDTPNDTFPPPSLFMADNLLLPSTKDWDIYQIHYSSALIPSGFKRQSRIPSGPFPITVQPAAGLLNEVMTNVGANARLDCQGRWVNNQDQTDQRVIGNVVDTKAQRGRFTSRFEGDPEFYPEHITDPTQVGGYQPVGPGSPCQDSDRDGMPDQWEVTAGLDWRTDDSAGMRLSADYTNVEHYLNGTPLSTSTLQHELHFAHLAKGLGLLTSELILFNLDPAKAASVRAVLRDDNGSPLSLTINGNQVSGEFTGVIPPLGTRSFKTDSTGLKTGSVVVTSDSPIGGVLLFGGQTGLAAVVHNSPLNEFFAPVYADRSAQIRTGIAVMSLDNQKQTLALTAYDKDGNPVASSSFELPARGRKSVYVDEMRWTPALAAAFDGTVMVSASQGRLAAMVLQTRPGELLSMPVAANFDRSGSEGASRAPALSMAGPSLLTAISDETESGLGDRLHFAHFGEGAGQLKSRIVLLNPNGTAADGRLRVIGDNGALTPIDLNGQSTSGDVPVTIPAFGLRSFETDGVGALTSGSVTVLADKPLRGFIGYSGAVGAEGIQGDVSFQTAMRAPVVSKTAGAVNTGIAVANLEATALTVNFKLFDEQGAERATGQILLAPNGHKALFVEELFPSVDLSDFLGSVSYTAAGRISSAVLQTRSGQLATMPAYPSLQ